MSKCGAQTEARSLAWLDHHAFYCRIGIPADNVRFCRRRAWLIPVADWAAGVRLVVPDNVPG